MLEIILIVYLWIKLGAILRDKGWEKTLWMQVLMVFLYLFSMYIGSNAYAIYVYKTEGSFAAKQLGLELYVAALVSAAICIGALFFYVTRMKKIEKAAYNI